MSRSCLWWKWETND